MQLDRRSSYGELGQCVSPDFNDVSGGRWRCKNSGAIDTARGPICVMHLRCWVRRGWITQAAAATALRELASRRAEDEAARLQMRIDSLS